MKRVVFVRVAVVVLCVAFGVSALTQTTGFTLVEYNAPQYIAPEDAPSSIVIAGKDEPGARMVVTGRTLVANQPVAGVSLYVFHTDAKGLYAIGVDHRAAELNPRLHGALRTDADGRYQYETTRPGSYDNGPAHVHYMVSARGFEPLLIALQFEDDPIVIQLRKYYGKLPLDLEAFKTGPCKSRPDCVLTQPVMRDPQGVSHVTRDIQMVRQ